MRIDMRFAVLALTVGLTLVFSGICSAQPAEEGADSGPSGEVRMPVDKNVLPLDFELNTDSGKAQSDKAEGDKAQNDKAGTEASTDGKTVGKPADKKAPAQEKKTSAKEPAKKMAAPAKTVQPKPVEKAETQKPAVADKKEEVTPAGYGAVKDVEMEQTKDGYVFWVYTDKPVEKTKYMNLPGPRRLVVDLVGNWKKHGPSIYRLEKGAIKHVRCGEHKDRLRVVIDFMDPNGKGEITPKLESVPKGLTITIPANQL